MRGIGGGQKVAKSGVQQQKRLYASDPNAPPKVAYPWKDPMNPGNWKEEHLVFVILGGWGAVIAGGKAALS